MTKIKFSSAISGCPLKRNHDDYKSLIGFNIFGLHRISIDDIHIKTAMENINLSEQCIIQLDPTSQDESKFIYLEIEDLETNVCMIMLINTLVNTIPFSISISITSSNIFILHHFA